MRPISTDRARRAGWRAEPGELRADLAEAGRRLWLPAIALVAGMMLLGLLITHLLGSGWLGRQDAAVDRELAADRTGTLNAITAVLTGLAATPTVIGLTALAAGILRVVSGRWREVVFLALATAGETAIFLLTTLVVHRSRPPVPHLDVAPPTSSFPSGHTAAAVCCYGSIAAVLLWRYRQPVLRAVLPVLAGLLPLLIGASRLYRGMHFPTDVLAGLLLGGSWLTATGRWYRRPG
ncbi:MAG TPA: phosphatase PAP2 family protein [Mycobacteriales bacterium]|nr:phosphatase PAP2 family protein [Mycobacteriales bacterium]